LFLRGKSYKGKGMNTEHTYKIGLMWTGNRGSGTETYTSYERAHTLQAEGKPDLLGSADPLFRGDSTKWNPEELLLASLSSCHMLWYLHLCANHKIIVQTYEDTPQAQMRIESTGAGQFVNAALRPVVTITQVDQRQLAESLHSQAHHSCFIANSVNFPISLNPTIAIG
jgi:organic hydroperoxide reductase OsmC/OhrA